MYALRLAEDGRVLEIMDERYQTDETPVVADYPQEDAYHYRYVDGEWVYDPVPRPVSLEERVTDVESDVASLTAAIEKGLSL